MKNSQIKTYSLGTLIPGKKQIKPDSLRFFTQVWRNLGTLDGLIYEVPTVFNVEDRILCLAQGVNRAVWYAINGRHTIDAREKVVTLTDTDPSLGRIVEAAEEINNASGVHNIYALAARVKDLGQYIAGGPTTVRITTNDLITGKRFDIPKKTFF